MGIDLSTFTHLAALAGQHNFDGRSLMLGRQKFRLMMSGPERQKRINRSDPRPFDAALRAAGLAIEATSLVQEDGYAERMFDGLGFGAIESLDFSDFEGAQVTWALNNPVPHAWHGRYNFIFDGCTLEHVFDVRQSFQNVYDMLDAGGIFVSSTPLNNYPEHGFYQFTPELVWTWWGLSCGCEIVTCLSCSAKRAHVQDFPDPKSTGRRLKIASAPRRYGAFGRAEPLLMVYAVQKPHATAASQPTLQSDYAIRWEAAQ